jgi:lipid-A-disaccharide synthase
MDQEIVKELIQNDLNADQLKIHLTQILNPEYQQQLKESYHDLSKKLGGVGASTRAAKHIVNFLEKK